MTKQRMHEAESLFVGVRVEPARRLPNNPLDPLPSPQNSVDTTTGPARSLFIRRITVIRWLAIIAAMLIGLWIKSLSQTSEVGLPRAASSDLSEAVRLADGFIAEPNITYVTVQNYQAKLDIY